MCRHNSLRYFKPVVDAADRSQIAISKLTALISPLYRVHNIFTNLYRRFVSDLKPAGFFHHMGIFDFLPAYILSRLTKDSCNSCVLVVGTKCS